MGKQPRKVDTIPEGYTFSHKDPATGRDIYMIKSSTPGLQSSSVRVSKPASNFQSGNGSKTVLRPPIKKAIYPSNNEDAVYMESITPVNNVPINKPIYEDNRIDRKLQTSIHPNIDYYKYPDPNAGYSQATDKYFDKATQKEIQPNFFDASGNYTPVFIDAALKANEGANLGTVKQGNPRVTTNPNVTTVLLGNENDKSGGMKGVSGIGTGGYKKGGLVASLKKRYAVGGNINFNEGSSLSGVVGQNDEYSKQRQDNAASSQKQKTEQQLKNEQNVKSGLGNILSGYGSSYYSSQLPENNADATRSGVLSAVSKTGAIGGVIGGVAGLGDTIGKPIKQKSEALNQDGALKNDSKARNNAIIGGILSPSKALAARSSYKGGYTDISGKGYTDSIEAAAQKQIQQVKAANLASQQQQTLLNRDNNDFDAALTTPYDLRNSHFDKDKQLILGDGSTYDPNRPRYKSGGVVSKIKQMCSDGGEITGKGTGKSDSINAKVEANSFVIPAENAPIAEEIRKKFLKVPKKKANLNQDKGEEVKLSNGEHLFTPKEDEKLEAMGIDLDVLAPNAEEGKRFDNGGKIKNKSEIEKKKKEAYDATTKVQNELGFDTGNDTYESASGNRKTYNELITPPLSWKGGKQEWKDAVDRQIRSGKVKPYSNGLTSKYASGIRPPLTKINPEMMESKNIALSALKQDNELRKNKEIENANAAINATSANKEVKAPTLSRSNKKSGLSNALGNVDPTAFVGVGQTALGLNMLKGQKRPVDNFAIDSTYNNSVNRAINYAKFGLTPEQQFAANQDIQGSLNDSKYAALNSAGGNGVQAFNLTRAAANDAWRARLGLKTADTNLRMQKQQYADAQVANRADLLANNRRQAFSDAMNTFQQKQQAGSELIGAGLANSIGAYRFNQDLKARQNADYERGRWVTDYGNTQ